MGRLTSNCPAVRLALLLGILLVLSANLDALADCRQAVTFSFNKDIPNQVNNCKTGEAVKLVNVQVTSAYTLPTGALDVVVIPGSGATNGGCARVWLQGYRIHDSYGENAPCPAGFNPTTCPLGVTLTGPTIREDAQHKKSLGKRIHFTAYINFYYAGDLAKARAYFWLPVDVSFKAPECPAQKSVTVTDFTGVPLAPASKPTNTVGSKQVSSDTSVEAFFAESSATFVVAYAAPQGGFEGEVTHKLPFDYADYKNGLVKLTPAPLRVESGSVVATWDVKLAPAESFKVTVEVAKPVDASVMEKFEAPAVNPSGGQPVVVSPGFVSPDGSKLLSVSEDFTKIELGYSLPSFTAPTPSPTAAPGCTDSDGGVKLDVKGAVTYNGQVREDHCNFNDRPANTKVNEMYCVRKFPLDNNWVDCPYGCKDGACLFAPTSTPKPRKEIKQKGFRTKRGSTVESATLTAITIKYAVRDQSAPMPVPAPMASLAPAAVPAPAASPSPSPVPDCLNTGSDCGSLPGSKSCCAPAACQFNLAALKSRCVLPSGVAPAPSVAPAVPLK